MFAMNLVTGPSFFGGLLYGLNNRMKPEYKADPYAHYKLLSLTTTMGYLYATYPIVKDTPLKMTPGLVFIRLGASMFVSGTTFCMGTMLTKIPSVLQTKEDEKKGTRITLF